MSERKAEHIFTCTANLPESRQISVNGNFYEGETVAERNAKLDGIMDALERQRTRFEIPIMEKELEQRGHALQQNLDQMESIAEQLQRKKGKANEQMLQQNLNTFRTNVEKIKKDIEDGQRKLEDMRARVAA